MCTPFWYNETLHSGTCPFGTRLPGDVTIPNDFSTLQAIAVVYSFIPFIVAAWVLVYFLYNKRGTCQFYILSFLVAVTIVNELIIKKLIRMPRPGASGLLTDDDGRHVGSCNHTCGMPSSHACFAIGTCSLFFLEAALSVVPSAFVPESKLASFKAILIPDFDFSRRPVGAFLALWSLLLLPVPIMRVVLYDHSVTQVCLGGFLGLVYAAIWFALSLQVRELFKGSLGSAIGWGMLTHNLAPPSAGVRTLSVSVVAPAADGRVSDNANEVELGQVR
eukprot:TRINITY_DN7951_c0_g1_i1.p1 TRINITY_DN7951_c0_g1~~TRINITY_DN7951_c0_g1_i1.p1  ORF type:complete len:276 (-),score=22.97 TRINITY_DN7951_c0_g1_i1:317-1144(-)